VFIAACRSRSVVLAPFRPRGLGLPGTWP
jgi:hypothetical protein